MDRTLVVFYRSMRNLLTMDINLPEVIAEVCAAFVEYERALAANDIQTMDALFWDALETVRYGIAEIQHGGDAIRQWRETCEPVPASRALHRTVITTFGRDFATVSTEFTSEATPLIGRQMQSWARLGPAGTWKIVAAHVSLIPEP
jgi:hypothetical protein